MFSCDIKPGCSENEALTRLITSNVTRADRTFTVHPACTRRGLNHVTLKPCNSKRSGALQPGPALHTHTPCVTGTGVTGELSKHMAGRSTPEPECENVCGSVRPRIRCEKRGEKGIFHFGLSICCRKSGHCLFYWSSLCNQPCQSIMDRRGIISASIYRKGSRAAAFC